MALPSSYRNLEDKAGVESGTAAKAGPRRPAPEASAPAIASRWWRTFNSRELDRLEEQALAGNFDLKAAVHRIAQAAAEAGVAEASLWPSVKLNADRSMESPAGGGVPRPDRPSADGKVGRSHQLGLQASYEVDLWGKTRASIDAALRAVEASQYDREVVILTLTADVGTTYFQYLGLQDRLAVAKRNVANMRRVLETVRRRVAIGEGADFEISQQESLLAQAEASVPILALEAANAQARLALLTGQSPTALVLSGTSLTDLTAPTVAPGLPSALLLRRPDLRKAEATLASAQATIEATRARLLPSFTLTGELGIGSVALSTLLSPSSILFSLAADVAQTIFDAGKTENEIKFSEARARELAELYRQTVLSALRDVEAALASIRYTAIQAKAQTRMVTHARSASALSAKAFDIGLADYLTVLEAERTQYRAEDERIQASLARLIAAVDLFKALGGGFTGEIGSLDGGTAGATGTEGGRGTLF